MADYLDRTEEHIEKAMEILKDDTKQKSEILNVIADMKINLYEDKTRMNNDMVAQEAELIATREQLQREKETNITLVDKIRGDNNTPEIIKNGEANKEAEIAKKKELRLAQLTKQFGEEYAKVAIQSETFE